MTTLSPHEFNNLIFYNGHPKLDLEHLNTDEYEIFDVVVSYSSIEHSGLSRYGDAPHPWGDLVAMAKAWCAIKPSGLAFIGIPVAQRDNIEYNAHR